ncbi:hypothetical protein NQ317_003353 [Molorchus minor]|uniref:Ribonucleoside-diphosphate reductase n=1 Tax=Molorchus minor TaxID=1323400 RepID=A0ABQ9K955_9CUCU|nr:hypothetical protein NQ317_003353 [Molorchus minor]
MTEETKLYVTKRNCQMEEVKLEELSGDIQKLCYGLNPDFINPMTVSQKVVDGLYSGVCTTEIVNLAAETAAMMTIEHPDYAILGARIAMRCLHRETKDKFSEVIKALYENTRRGMICNSTYEVTLERSYLLKVNGKVVERPQHMLMRVAVGIHGEDINAAIETYNLMSEGYFTHASPTLFSAGTPKPQMSSCFLLTVPEDSIEGICKCLTQCACISKSAGGIGLSVHNVRAKGTTIEGTSGEANGLVPMPGAFAIYVEPWHADIFDFLNLKKNTGKEEVRARDLFYALWIPDLFMKRVENDATWSLMCPHLSPGLADCWGIEFEMLYEQYEKEGKFVRQVPAREVWRAIIVSQIETGMPYMLYKDACNKKSNQQRLGTIKSSNLCTEIIEYTAPDEIAVCNLASIAVNMFVNPDNKSYDFEKLKEVTKVVTRNLNKIIDVNYYPIPEARNSNMRHRPIGIGVQGLADAFILLRMPFDSAEAGLLNRQIFETIYFAALETSCEIAKNKGTYVTYEGSPVSKGILQYDMWNVTPTDLWNWNVLKEKDCQEWSEFQVVNQHLVKDLIDKGLWDNTMRNQILANGGSIQNIPTVPDDLKAIYKTVWEISQKNTMRDGENVANEGVEEKGDETGLTDLVCLQENLENCDMCGS